MVKFADVAAAADGTAPTHYASVTARGPHDLTLEDEDMPGLLVQAQPGLVWRSETQCEREAVLSRCITRAAAGGERGGRRGFLVSSDLQGAACLHTVVCLSY